MAKKVMSKAQFEALQDKLGAYNDDGDGLRPDYSGRAMYGASCLGYVCDDGPARFQMAVAEVMAPQLLGLGADDEEFQEPDLDMVKEAMEVLSVPSADSMGRSSIYYYRGIQVEGYEQEARF